MNIAIMAHDVKKELMVQFCIAYCGILCKYTICATSTTGKLVSEATGLKIENVLSGMQGGNQQIAARAQYNEIDLVLFFRDPNNMDNAPSEASLLRSCDLNSIPVATNIATAEILVRALDRGDLDFREIMNASRKR